MKAIKTSWLVALLVVIFLILSSFYTVTEGNRGLLLWLGKIERDSNTQKVHVMAPGLHFKVPLFNRVKIFDVRLQTLDIESSRIMTAEKKEVIVDYYAKWKVINLPVYFTRTGGNATQAELLLRQRLNDGLRAEFGKRNISDVVSGDRVNIMKVLIESAKSTIDELGITVIDVRIKRIDLPTEVSSAVYDRMRAERERVATEHRAAGKAKAEAIRANADAFVTVTLAKAQADSVRFRGEGDAQATKIYGNAYNRDADFYAFYRSLSAYKNAFSKENDVLILKPDGQFFKFFNKMNNNQK